MLASIILDQGFSHYTNLDTISGRVIIKTSSSANISSIVAKLEGESRTRLLPPPNTGGDRQKAQMEFHKILYKVQIVFPPPDVVEEKVDSIVAGKTTFTLPPGQHEYPFSFKFPFNNDCMASGQPMNTISMFGGIKNVDAGKAPLHHIKQTLPPTITGFPGEAEIRYYMKVTVNRPNMFKENARAYVPFNFCPIEPPRPPKTDAQVFARRRHQFQGPFQRGKATTKSKMRSLLGRSQTRAPDPQTPGIPAVAIDIRLPEPAILTCARELPLKILVLSTNGVKDSLCLQSLQIELISITKVRAQEFGRTEQGSTVIMSTSNMGIPLEFPEGSDEAEIDSRLWRGQKLPNTIPPSFEACNISRSYELVTRIGVKYEPVGFQPQYTTADLRLPVQLYSGITPPAQLLERTNARPQAASSTPQSTMPSLPARKPVPVPRPVMPVEEPSVYPPQLHEDGFVDDAPPVYSEAPPSYEDSMVHDLSPADGLRRNYAPPASAEDPLFSRNEKN